MDAQSRGRADEIDPADQWVLNPRTGNYELQLGDSTAQQRPKVAAPRRSAPAPAPTAPSPGVPKPRRGDGPPGGRRGGRSRKGGGGGRRKKALLITSGTLAFLLVGGGVAAYLYYDHLNGNLNVTDVAGAGTGGFKKDQAINILVIGTDKRTGAGNESYGDKDSVGHADTTILFHVSKDRTNATALSIPRDLITNIPACPTKQPDGSTKTIPPAKGIRFNTSLGQGGRDAGCTMRTVKELTGIEVDHFMMADFNAVKTLSTAVGGVPVCLDKAVNDEGGSQLKLGPGEHRLSGEQALAFVRTRHGFGNNSDLDRIKIQQQFLGSMMRQMKSQETLTSPKKFLSLAEAATKSLSVDSGIGSIAKLTDLAGELKDIDTKNITFTTLPVKDNPAEPEGQKATVVVENSLADPLLQMIRGDISLTEVEKKEQAAKEAADADAKAKQDALLQGNKAPAASVRVDVYNGGGPTGAASTTQNWLSGKGVPKVGKTGNAPEKVGATQLEYAPNQADQARALAELLGLPATAMKMGTADAGAKTAMKLTLGADFKEPGAPLSAAPDVPALSDDVQQAQADKAICAK
ncbi:LCP family protein [Streptomyces sp. NBC_01294]|uniref:LCP family protein n=1 Tax=Streptomyces sp. NBC_01294 TaxID=2903815 RepID=UPI002DDACD64|nr:LCP family protein [Streptomyces sp. NBC_01294]WRZ58983.1 LCP family protein [Streptomyces sp. NBC_01294]